MSLQLSLDDQKTLLISLVISVNGLIYQIDKMTFDETTLRESCILEQSQTLLTLIQSKLSTLPLKGDQSCQG